VLGYVESWIISLVSVAGFDIDSTDKESRTLDVLPLFKANSI
jgi:hypothetical protein